MNFVAHSPACSRLLNYVLLAILVDVEMVCSCSEKFASSSNQNSCVHPYPQATMLKKMKGKMKRRNTEPTMLVSPGLQLAPLSAPDDGESPTDTNLTVF